MPRAFYRYPASFAPPGMGRGSTAVRDPAKRRDQRSEGARTPPKSLNCATPGHVLERPGEETMREIAAAVSCGDQQHVCGQAPLRAMSPRHRRGIGRDGSAIPTVSSERLSAVPDPSTACLLLAEPTLLVRICKPSEPSHRPTLYLGSLRFVVQRRDGCEPRWIHRKSIGGDRRSMPS